MENIEELRADNARLQNEMSAMKKKVKNANEASNNHSCSVFKTGLCCWLLMGKEKD